MALEFHLLISWDYREVFGLMFITSSIYVDPCDDLLHIQVIFGELIYRFSDPKYIEHTFKSFFHLSVATLVESFQILTYFWV